MAAVWLASSFHRRPVKEFCAPIRANSFWLPMNAWMAGALARVGFGNRRLRRMFADALVREHAAASFDAPIGRLAFPGAQRASWDTTIYLPGWLCRIMCTLFVEPRVPLPIITRALKGVSDRIRSRR